MTDNTQNRDGLRVLFPTLIYEAWYPEFAAQEVAAKYSDDLPDNSRKKMAVIARRHFRFNSLKLSLRV